MCTQYSNLIENHKQVHEHLFSKIPAYLMDKFWLFNDSKYNRCKNVKKKKKLKITQLTQITHIFHSCYIIVFHEVMFNILVFFL